MDAIKMIKIDAVLHKQLKVKCVQRGENMIDVINMLVAKYLEENKKK